jgi:hypothetical protein
MNTLMNDDGKTRREIRTFSAIVSIMFLSVIFYQIAFSKTHTVCGKVLGIRKGRTSFVLYGFWHDGKYYDERTSCAFIKDDISIDSMKQMKCVEIKCSFISNSINDLTDKRLRSD